jgi:hypothetical protein
VFRRVLNPEENEAPLPVVEPPAFIPALPERGGRQGSRIARYCGNGRVVQENFPLPGRDERHRRCQQLIDAERRNNWEIVEQLQPIPNLHQPALQPEEVPLPALIQGPGIIPEAPATRNINICLIYSANAVDCILQWAIHIVPIASLHLEIWMLPICHYVPGAEDPSEM